MMSSLSRWFRSRLGTIVNRAGGRKKTTCKLHLEALEDRTVPSTIQGTVFNDPNSNAVLDAGEAGRSDWTVFLDVNENAVIDPGETTTTTDVNGHYFFDTTNANPAFLSTSGQPVDLVALKLEVGSEGRFLNTTVPLSLKVNRTNEPDATRNFGTIFVPTVDVAPAGPEMLVNQVTAGAQGGVSVSAATTDGRYVVAWQNGATVSGRIFNADGSARTAEFTLDSVTGVPIVAMAGNGQFAVSWSDAQGLKARAFGSSGVAIGSVATVAAANATTQILSSHVAADNTGNFVVTYAVSTLSKNWGWSTPTVKAQRYTASGAANGNAITVATPTLVNGFQGVAMAGAGNFVVTWDDISNRGPNNVFAKQYTASGKSTGGQITVATGDALGLTLWSSVAMNATGQFVVTYEHRGVGRQAQVYNANGTPVPGGPVTFVSGDFIDGTAAAVAMDSAGNATFAWTGNFDDRYGLSDVHMSRLPFGATSAEPVTIVNTTTEGLQSAPSVAATGSGTFVVAWQGYSPSDDAGIYTQRYGQQAQIADFTASANPVTAGTIMTLTASNITDGNPAATINQVTFYYYDSTSTKVSVPGTQTSPGVWTCSIDTTGWTSGSQVTLFAQALDSYGVLSDPLALNLDVL